MQTLDAKDFDQFLGPRTMIGIGILLAILGGGLFRVAIAISGDLVWIPQLLERRSIESLGSLVLEFAGAALIQVGVYGTWRGWRRSLQRAEDALAKDPRAPILYLRTFLSDSFEIFENTTQARLAAALRKLGPCITIENPHADVPEPGFKRLAAAMQWRVTVKERICTARLVVLRASRPTEALEWEIETVVANCAPRGFLIFLPYELEGDSLRHAQLNYDAFRAAVNGRFPRGLPEWQPETMFIAFEEGWESRPVCGRNLRKTIRRALLARSTVRNFSSS